MAAVIDPPEEAQVPMAAVSLGTSAAVNASIDAYLGAGDGMASIMGLTMKVGAVLIVLIVVAWVIGLLPGAVRFF